MLSPVVRFIPEPIRASARGAAYQEVKPTLDAETQKGVRELLVGDFAYGAKLAALEAQLGRTFPEWKKPVGL